MWRWYRKDDYVSGDVVLYIDFLNVREKKIDFSFIVYGKVEVGCVVYLWFFIFDIFKVCFIKGRREVLEIID